jgi:hypothetical protein
MNLTFPYLKMNNLLKQNETNKDGIIMQTYMKVNQYKLQRYVEENNLFAVNLAKTFSKISN